MSAEIIKVLDALCERFGVAIDWTSNNVLPYLEQLCEKFINWEISTSIAWMIIMGVATVVFFIFAIVIHNIADEDGVWIGFGFILLLTVVVCGVQIFDIIECKTFPEKAIYDYIQMNININK